MSYHFRIAALPQAVVPASIPYVGCSQLKSVEELELDLHESEFFKATSITVEAPAYQGHGLRVRIQGTKTPGKSSVFRFH